jgi:hypothetical protein
MEGLPVLPGRPRANAESARLPRVRSLAFLAWSEDLEAAWGVALAGAVAIVAIGIRSTVMGVFITPAGVVVRNWIRTHHVPWPRVRAFELDSHALYLVTRDDLIPCRIYDPAGVAWLRKLFLGSTLERLQAELRNRPAREVNPRPDAAP